MRTKLRHALAFKSLIDYMVEVGTEVNMQMGDGGGLAVWCGQTVGTYPSPKKDQSYIRFILNVELLSMALECVQHRDELVVEWNGKDVIQFQLSHPSGRSTDIDFPIVRMTSDQPPSFSHIEATHERRISSNAYTRIMHRLLENADTKHIRISFWEDGIEFRTSGNEARFGMRTWHPTHSVSATPESGVLVTLSKDDVEHTMAMRLIDSIVALAVDEKTHHTVIAARGKDGLILTVVSQTATCDSKT